MSRDSANPRIDEVVWVTGVCAVTTDGCVLTSAANPMRRAPAVAVNGVTSRI